MKRILFLTVAIVIFFGAVSEADAQNLKGTWTLRIMSTDRREIATATLQFLDSEAESCMGGDWRQVLVASAKTGDEKFFPLSEPLSYAVKGSEIVIGRNEICDAYLHLRGHFKNGSVKGVYSSFGISGGKILGRFSLSRTH
jgi:hypothetical protein